MGRIFLIILVIVAVILLWKAFGPSSWKRSGENNANDQAPQPAVKGPDDDEEFLWNLEKQRFKERREKESRDEAARLEQQRRKERERRHESEESDET